MTIPRPVTKPGQITPRSPGARGPGSRGAAAVSPKAAGDLAYAKRFAKKGNGGKGGGAADQGYFPSAAITPADEAAIRRQSTSQVADMFRTSPLPTVQSYTQPFVDASTRQAKLGTDMLAAIGGAASYSQGLSNGLQSWIQQNVGQAQAQAQGAMAPGAPQIPAYTSAAATAAPIASYGTSQTQALNALVPYAVGSANQYQANIGKAQDAATKDYYNAVQQRTNDITSKTTDVYGTNLKALQDSRQNVEKNSIAEYIALTTAGMKARDAERKTNEDAAKAIKDERQGRIDWYDATTKRISANVNSYKAHHPKATSTPASQRPEVVRQKAVQAALKIYQAPRPTSDLAGYNAPVTFSWLKPKYDTYGDPTTPVLTTETVKIPVNSPDPNDARAAFAKWAAGHPQYKGAKYGSVGAPSAVHTGVKTPIGPGAGTAWQKALTQFSTWYRPNAGETPQQFRSRMAKLMEAAIPRPKAKSGT